MKIDSKLDKILDLLYDEGELIFKQVPTTDIIVFGKRKFNLDWNENDILFIMNVLQDEGYVIMNKGDFTGSRLTMPTFSLTTKGVRLKQNGGFVFKNRIQWLTNFLIISASIVTILVGIVTCIDLFNKYFKLPTNTSTNNNSCSLNKTKNNTNIKVVKTIIKYDSITNKVNKPQVKPVNK